MDMLHNEMNNTLRMNLSLIYWMLSILNGAQKSHQVLQCRIVWLSLIIISCMQSINEAWTVTPHQLSANKAPSAILTLSKCAACMQS